MPNLEQLETVVFFVVRKESYFFAVVSVPWRLLVTNVSGVQCPCYSVSCQRCVLSAITAISIADVSKSVVQALNPMVFAAVRGENVVSTLWFPVSLDFIPLQLHLNAGLEN